MQYYTYHKRRATKVYDASRGLATPGIDCPEVLKELVLEVLFLIL